MAHPQYKYGLLPRFGALGEWEEVERKPKYVKRQKANEGGEEKVQLCARWIVEKYATCIETDEAAQHNIYMWDGKLYKQRYIKPPLPVINTPYIPEGPLLHFRKWKRALVLAEPLEGTDNFKITKQSIS